MEKMLTISNKKEEEKGNWKTSECNPLKQETEAQGCINLYSYPPSQDPLLTWRERHHARETFPDSPET